MAENELGALFAEQDKTILRRLFVEGRGRIVGRPLYRGVTGMELALQRAADRFLAGGQADQSLVNTQLTAVIKVFERPAELKRLLASIRRFFPDLPIIVVDDSREPQIQPGVQTITMPFNSGLSAGRNEALRNVTTRYVLILDEDLVFYRHTDLCSALALMESEPRIDIMGGDMVNLPFYKVTDYRQINLLPTEAQATLPAGSILAGLPVYDIVANLFIARTDRLRQVMWDDRFRRNEHGDFFTRAKGVLTSVYNENLRCLHVRTVFDRAYLAHRFDIAETREYLLTHYYGFSQAQGQEQDADSAAE